MTSENFPLFLVLFLPLIIFYFVFRKSWVDRELYKSFFLGLIAGIVAIFLTKLIYYPIEIYLGANLRSFVSAPKDWWKTLSASVAIVGFVEELMKAAGGFIAGYQICFLKRSTVLFMAFAGCALSFSLIENLQYYMIFGAEIVFPRILISSTAHLFFTCISAAISAVAMARFRKEGAVSVRILGGILLASLAHGLFDFLVFHFDIKAWSGIIISLIALFLYGIYEFWIVVLKMDIPAEAALTVCSGCGAFSLDRARYCGFCGARVLRNRRDFSFKVSEN